MTVNQKIEKALSKLVGGNIWPDVVPKEDSTTEWITYTIPSMPVEYGDDRDMIWEALVTIHYVHKGKINYLDMKKKIVDQLRQAGFSVTYVDPFYDDGLASSHIIINANILEESD